ncbi:MAG: glycoside hydrolase family 5 protein [Lachnospiraceae bacterium]|nr:glycoside hydrolase family 5 protein [Lachnospiraceae bacterium]
MKKIFLRSLLLGLFITLLTGCGKDNLSPSDTSSQTSVSVSVSTDSQLSVSLSEETASENSETPQEPATESIFWDFEGTPQLLSWDKLEAVIPAELTEIFIGEITLKCNYEVVDPSGAWEILLRKGWEDSDVIRGIVDEAAKSPTELTIRYLSGASKIIKSAPFLSVYGTNVLLKSITLSGEVLPPDSKTFNSYIIHLAKDSHIDITSFGKRPKITSIEDESILTLNGSRELIALKEGCTKINYETADGSYEGIVTVFDQSTYISPDYRGINTENYFTVLADHKKAMDELLDCDIISFKMDYYNGSEGYCKDVDSNLLDLLEGAYDLLFTCTYDNTSQHHYYSLITGFEEDAEYLDLSFAEGYLSSFEGEKNVQITVPKESADSIKKMGRLQIVGEGYKVSRVTLIGSPVSEYTGITATADSPVPANGDLRVKKANIVGMTGDPIRLNGVACGWNSGWLQYCNSKTYAFLRDDWGCKAIRIGITTDQEQGYCTEDGLPDELYYYVCAQVDACIESGMYAVVDWHMFRNPLTNMAEAVEFFEKVSQKYAKVPNVIYEICNEPCDIPETPEKEDSWKNIKKYANTVIPVIRNNSPDAIIICGSPSWSNDLRSVMNDPLKYDNLVYTDHIYEWHYEYQLPLEKEAVKKGFALLITETNPSYDDGGKIGKKDDSHYQEFEKLWSKNNIGIFMHYFSNDAGFTALTKETNTRYGWTEENYTEVGKYMRKLFRKAAGLE